jgi:hypothetical protein
MNVFYWRLVACVSLLIWKGNQFLTGIPLEDGLMTETCSGSNNNPRVEAGKNTSTVIPACHKRRRKGNPVVSGETVLVDLRKG